MVIMAIISCGYSRVVYIAATCRYPKLYSVVFLEDSVRGQRVSDGTAASSVRNSRPLATLHLRSICNWRDIPYGEGYSTVYGKSVNVSRRMK